MASSLLGVDKSVSGQAWTFRCGDDAAVQALTQSAGLDDFTARLLAGRDVSADEAENYLNPTLRGFMPDPSTLADMDKAASLILDAVERKDSITIFADYDVDGGTSAAQIIRWGRHMGREFGLYVPDRVKEGYGPSGTAFRHLKDEGANLVITVDCGAAAHEALVEADDIGLPVIVIDHHLMHGDLPPCAALVNPNRNDDTSGLGDLAAAGVSFMLLAALNREAKRRGHENTPDLLSLLGLTALGTVCDVVPLKGLNRAFVSQGLKVLSQNKIIGLAALADVAGAQPPFTTYHAGFVLGPRINAGGRIGQADMGAILLSTENAQTAYGHAAELDRVNQDRKKIQDDMLQQALDLAAKDTDPNSVLVIAMQGWHPGVIGVVAGRLKDRFKRPAIVIGVDDEGVGKGSGRSMTGVHLGNAIVAAKDAGLLSSGGGHAMAGGLTVPEDNIEALKSFLNQELATDIATARQGLSLKVDALLSPSGATDALIDRLDQIGPYGAGNPQPLFVFPNLRIAYAERVRGGHVRCAFEDNGGARISGICFRADETGLDEVLLSPEAKQVHVAGRVKRDSWKGRTRIDVNVVDLAFAT
ncbi:MAG: single-stranded-DNA-specific exonuclease RecJ [Alphaproteobacteria bacterium]